jgi:hypothetical protein
MRSPAVAFVAFTTVACAGPRATAPAATATHARASAALFDFHAGFWINLHLRLYAESGPRPPSDVATPASEADRATWAAALAAYKQRYPERGMLTLLMNDELVRVSDALVAAETAPDLASAADVPADLRAVLESAAPVYRRARWPDDARADAAFIARLRPLVAQHGTALAASLARAYETAWPATPGRVDVAAYAGPLGAYTRDRITIAATDRRHEGDYALEIIFHEASHLLAERAEGLVASASAAAHKPLPATLWHAVLFYMTGELVRRELGGAYEPYADHNLLWQRAPDWAPYRALFARSLTPHLDGATSLATAITAVVAAAP